MNLLLNEVRLRSHELDSAILSCVEVEQRISLKELVKTLKKPLKLIQNRIEILNMFRFVEVEEDVIVAGNQTRNTNISLPLNAKDLDLTAREKLVLKALASLYIADLDTIFEWLVEQGDHIKNKLTVYFALRKLVSMGVVEVIRKSGSDSKLKGRKLYYRIKEPIEVTEDVSELLMECKIINCKNSKSKQ